MPLPSMRHLAAVALLVPAALAAQGERRESNAFTWQGDVPAGRWIVVKNLNGPIRVERGGDRVEVAAERRWGRDGDPQRVRFTAEKARDGQSMVICALWRETARCDEDSYESGRRDWSEDSGDGWVSVEFVVRVPEGVRVDVQTVNGGLEVRGATAEVVARTTNGSVTVEMPASLGAEVEMSTVNGRVSTEFPVTLSGRIDPRRLRATIGDGSRRVTMRTVNGSVELRRAADGR